MILDSIKYIEYKGKNNEWGLTYTNLGKINLIVGKNSSGKTRTITLVSNLARLLSGKSKPIFQSSNYEVSFSNKNDVIKYKLEISGGKVIKEELFNNKNVLLKRSKNGSGKIFASKLGKNLLFQTPVTELTSNVRRDSLQHPFFEDLYEWGDKFNLYPFGTDLGRNTMIISNEEENTNNFKFQEENNVIMIFKKGNKVFGKKFISLIVRDMKKVGYDIESIGIDKPKNLISEINLLCINIKEKDIESEIGQSQLSQGMFRALSLIIQINYYNLSNESNCIVIDDIGEGLDFERSTNLIKLLIDKVEKSDIQLIMSTNDRFVMNSVPIKYWSVIKRSKNGSKIYNYKNSKKTFDEFEFTGLNNFDFFSRNFFEEGFKK